MKSAVLLLTIIAGITSLQICPPTHELLATSCICHAQFGYLICDGNAAVFNFNSSYNFNKLIIKNSPKLPFWLERLPVADRFDLQSLVILQDSPPEVTDNFEELLSLPSESFHVQSNNHIPFLYVDFLSRSLRHLSISQVGTLVMNDPQLLGEFTELEEIHLKQLKLNPPLVDLFLENLPLRVVHLNQIGLSGNFAFIPKICPTGRGVPIVIDLRDNNLVYFDFSMLFPERLPDCQYHLELGRNPWSSKLLTSQLEVLKQKGGTKNLLKIFLGNATLECNCDLQKMSTFIHDVTCVNFSSKRLEEIEC